MNNKDADKQDNITLTITGDDIKRKNYLKWDEYFMTCAFLTSKLCRNNINRDAACIVDENNRIVSVSYDSSICNDPDCVSDDDQSDDTICHAEILALINCNFVNSNEKLKMYLTKSPCNRCVKVLIRSKIVKIIYYKPRFEDGIGSFASEHFKRHGIKCQQYSKEYVNDVEIDFHRNQERIED